VNSQTALLNFILENPADDTARLVLADLLRESDDPDEQASGRFLWAGVVAHTLYESSQTDPLYKVARTELQTLATAGLPARWVGDLEIGPSPLTVKDWTVRKRIRDRVVVDVGLHVGVFTRGMLNGLTLGLAQWFDVAHKALGSWPIEFVKMNDVPGLEMQLVRHAEEWEVVCGFVRSNYDNRLGELDPRFWQTRETFGSRDAVVKWMVSRGYDHLQTAVDRLSEGDLREHF
jgi:uncharacterized protein (TIGR02996 family)